MANEGLEKVRAVISICLIFTVVFSSVNLLWYCNSITCEQCAKIKTTRRFDYPRVTDTLSILDDYNIMSCD